MRLKNKRLFCYFQLSMTAVVSVYPAFTCANDAVEFNINVLSLEDRKNINLKNFSRGNYIPPGQYVMEVVINSQYSSEHTVNWIENKKEETSFPCISHDMLQAFGLKDEYLKKVKWKEKGACLDASVFPGMYFTGSVADNTLKVNIPQEYLLYRSSNWAPSSQWEKGINGVLFDYYASVQSRKDQKKQRRELINGYGVAGINIGAWRIRADWQASRESGSSDSTSESWKWSRVYAYRPLPEIGAKLTIGEATLSSSIFDSVRYTGFNLLSDDNMLPPNLRGYAPEVVGVARTNARVIVRHLGVVVKETQVAAGPFRIQDINEMVNGTLDVTVEEQDGTTQKFTVNTASIPYLTRPGMLRYKLSGGRISDVNHNVYGPAFISSEFSFGISNGWSTYGGGIFSRDYTSLALGIGRDLYLLGALSFDVSKSHAQLKNEAKDLDGYSYRVSYSKNFDETNSKLTFAGYKFSDRNYLSFSDYDYALRTGDIYTNSKSMYTISFSQQIPDWRASVYLNYNKQTFWRRRSIDRHTLTFSKYFDFMKISNISFSGSALLTQNSDTKDKGVLLSLSIPLGDGKTVSYNSNNSSSTHSNQANFYNRINERESIQLSAGENNNRALASGLWSYDADAAKFLANLAYLRNSYDSASLSMEGGATLTEKGAALHRTSVQGTTRVMIDSDGVPGIQTRGNGLSQSTSRFGKAVITDVNDYYINNVYVDMNKLPDYADIDKSVYPMTLTEGAIGYRRLNVISGKKGIISFKTPAGEYLPFGANVISDQGKHLGIIGEQGIAYVAGLRKNEKLRVAIDSSNICEARLPANIPDELTEKIDLICLKDNE